MAAGSPPIWFRITGTPARSPQSSSWSMAAALNVSPATTSTPSPRALRWAASLPRVVVLPTPFTPTSSTTWVPAALKALGGRWRRIRNSSSFSTALGSMSAPAFISVRSRVISRSTALTPRSAWSSRSSSSSSCPSSKRLSPRRRPMGASTSSWVRRSPCLNLSNRPPSRPTDTSRRSSLPSLWVDQRGDASGHTGLDFSKVSLDAPGAGSTNQNQALPATPVDVPHGTPGFRAPLTARVVPGMGSAVGCRLSWPARSG